jgi:N-acetylglucosamine-6-sulfatase
VASQVEEADPPSDLPNISFVLADDLDLASVQKMPEITSLLAEGGATFEDSFVSYPTCCPSRATMLTGFYSHNHDVRGNKRPVGGFEKFRDQGLEEDTTYDCVRSVSYTAISVRAMRSPDPKRF